MEKYDTLSAERGLLKSLMTDSIALKFNISLINEKWFSNKERRFIFKMIKHYWTGKKTLFTSQLFEFVYTTRLKKGRELYKAEFNIITQKKVVERPENLMAILDDANRMTNVMDVLEEAVNLVEEGDVSEVESYIRQQSVYLGKMDTDKPSVDWFDINARRKLINDKKINPNKFLGIPTGFTKIDEKTGGMFPAEMFLTTALTSAGKSTFLKIVGMNVLNTGRNILHVTNEESQEQVLYKYDSMFMNFPFNTFKRATITDDNIIEWERKMGEWSAKEGKIIVKEIPQYTTISPIERELFELEEKGCKIDLIILDYLDHMKAIEKTWSDWDEEGKVAAEVSGLAIRHHIPVLTATQAATMSEKKVRTGSLDVYGSKKKSHKASTLFGIKLEEVTVIEDEASPHKGRPLLHWRIDVPKQRDGEKFWFKTTVLADSGYIVENYVEGGMLDLKKLGETVKNQAKDKKDKVEIEPVDKENRMKLENYLQRYEIKEVIEGEVKKILKNKIVEDKDVEYISNIVSRISAGNS